MLLPGKRDFRGLEKRRKRAGALFAAGQLTQAEISRKLGVSRQSVSRWYGQWQAQGASALTGAGRAGRRPKVDAQQLQQVAAALQQGPRANGFPTELWTLRRVAMVIERLTGIRYHRGHVWKILQAMDWTLQRPIRRAREQNRTALVKWVKQRWPAIKKELAGTKPGSSSRTKAGSRSCLVSAAPGRPKAKRRS